MPSASSPPPSKFNAAAPAAPVIWEPRSKPALTWKTMDQCEISRILKFSYCTIPFFWEYVAGIFTYIGQKIGLIYGRYLQFRILELPLNGGFQSMVPSWLLDPKVHGSSSPHWTLKPPGPYKFHEECYGDTWGKNMLQSCNDQYPGCKYRNNQHIRWYELFLMFLMCIYIWLWCFVGCGTWW